MHIENPNPDLALAAAQPDPLPWRTLTTRQAFQNRWLTVAVDQVALPDGRPYEYTRLEPAGSGVAICGTTPEGKVLLEREYRHGVGTTIWQLPGGLAAPGEDLLAAGLRELAEETGYRPPQVTPQSVRYLGAVWDNPAFGPMCSHIFAVQGLTLQQPVLQTSSELVTCHLVSSDWLKEAVRAGEIQDRVVVAALGYLLLNGWLS